MYIYIYVHIFLVGSQATHYPVSIIFDEEALIHHLAGHLDQCGYSVTYHQALMQAVGELRPNRNPPSIYTQALAFIYIHNIYIYIYIHVYIYIYILYPAGVGLTSLHVYMYVAVVVCCRSWIDIPACIHVHIYI